MAFIEVHAARWVLPVSLAVNVFLGTLVGVQLYGSPFDRPRPPPPRGEQLLEIMAAQVPARDAAILRELFARVDPEMRRFQQNRQDVTRRLHGVMGEATVDDAALQALIGTMRQINELQNQLLGGALREAAARLTPEGRRKLADWAKAADWGPPIGPGGRGPQPPPGPPPGPPPQ